MTLKSVQDSAHESAKDIVRSMTASIDAGTVRDTPYKLWFLKHCLPADVIAAAIALPFEAPALGGISGKREVHNATRKYFDAANMDRFAVCRAFNEAFQTPALTSKIEHAFGTKLSGTYLRVEYAQDTNGFWLEPHTDLGVKVFTMLLYVSPDSQHKGLGTDIYDNDKKHVFTAPFDSNAATIFVPSHNTYHGFEPRPIEGVRKSLVINFVTNEWRAREQLAFPDRPVA